MIRTLMIAGLALVLATGAHARQARSWKDFPGVSNTSYVDAAGEKALQLSMDIPAPPHAVFEAFTTSEGFKRWAVAVAEVELRTGGAIESSYDPKAKIGDPNNIKNQILTFIPDHLLVIRNIQAPLGFPGKDAFQKTVTVLEFTPIQDGKATRVRLTNTGYGSSPEAQAVYAHFEWGNAYTLAELRKMFEAKK